ncbi:MAG: protein phosphatase 2C domain-containing protein [Alphaproteobacteria bacterium]|nr:protein phosphatase 2C domain-containing protein [Alphaproteobacteria bacterium]
MSLFRIHVLDALTAPGNQARPNDDAFATAARCACVLDGATGLGDAPLMPGASDASWLAVEAAAILAPMADDPRLSARALIAETARALRERFCALRVRPPRENYEIPFASLMMLRACEHGQEAAWFGDCRAILRDASGAISAFGPGSAHRAQELARARGFKGLSSDTLRGEALPTLRRLRNFVNGPEGYGLLGPDERCADLLKVRRIEAQLPFEALLMSDGFYALVTDYKRYSDKGLLRRALDEGLAPLYAELRGIEYEDKDMRVHPRFKVSDDATALLVRAEAT